MLHLIRLIFVVTLSTTIIGCSIGLKQIQADFDVAEKTNTVAAYKEFMEKYPGPGGSAGPWRNSAMYRMQHLDFMAEKDHGNYSSIKTYIRKYNIYLVPGNELDDLLQFRMAEAGNTVESYRAYIDTKTVIGSYKNRAKELLRPLLYNSLTSEKEPGAAKAGMQYFLKTYPTGADSQFIASILVKSANGEAKSGKSEIMEEAEYALLQKKALQLISTGKFASFQSDSSVKPTTITRDLCIPWARTESGPPLKSLDLKAATALVRSLEGGKETTFDTVTGNIFSQDQAYQVAVVRHTGVLTAQMPPVSDSALTNKAPLYYLTSTRRFSEAFLDKMGSDPTRPSYSYWRSQYIQTFKAGNAKVPLVGKVSGSYDMVFLPVGAFVVIEGAPLSGQLHSQPRNGPPGMAEDEMGDPIKEARIFMGIPIVRGRMRIMNDGLHILPGAVVYRMSRR